MPSKPSLQAWRKTVAPSSCSMCRAFAESGLEQTDHLNFCVCELPHTPAPKNVRPSRRLSSEGVQMLGWILSVVVAMGLIWSFAAMFELVPIVSDSVAISSPAK